MKRLILVLFVLLLMNGYLMSQNVVSSKTHGDLIRCLPQMGQDSLLVLNECESNYLNILFQNRKGDFDFSGKKVAFFRGNTGTIPCSKDNYFAVVKKGFNMDSTLGLRFCGWVCFFEEEEAKQVGYDAVVFYGCKKNLSKKEVIKRLNKRTKRGTKWFVPRF